jgi:hypothetical protein
MALRPIQDRAVCARWPGTAISARSVPWQPPSISAELGSISTAKSPARSSGLLPLSRSSPLRSAATSSQS